MKKSNTVFLTTIFPEIERYLGDFFISLEKQTEKDFDILVINDGFKDFNNYTRRFSNLNIIDIEVRRSPAKNREAGINFAIELGYKYIIFGDSDDYFSHNRVDISLKMLNDYDIVVNDLTLFDEKGVISKKYISNRIKNNSEINIEFIKIKNIFGLSNTAIKVGELKHIKFDRELIAVDWHLFSLLLLQGKKAIFTNKVETFYRQYSSNTVGLGNLSQDDILKGIDVKIKHYDLLQNEENDFKALFQEMNLLKRAIKDESYIENLQKQSVRIPFWWEEVRLIQKIEK